MLHMGGRHVWVKIYPYNVFTNSEQCGKIPQNQILQLKDRGAVVISNPGVRRCRAVAGTKGAAAEGERSQFSPGQTNNIRLTVAFAENYVLIDNVDRRQVGAPGADLAKRLNTVDANGIYRFSFSRLHYVIETKFLKRRSKK